MRDMDFVKDGKYYKRVNKARARKLYNDGIQIVLYPIEANPFSMWAGSGYTINISNIDENDKYPPTFDSIVNSFEYYNCNSEMGQYTKFYIINGGY